jgi:predicted PhzF superfamily epimerase YddE/YHI9
MAALPYSVVDAFTDRPFAGNPAAVYLLPAWRDHRWLQLVAREMNLSETAYLVRNRDGFELRWFTPAVEVDLCGHATLASAHVLWTQGHSEASELRFETKSGTLKATRRGGRIELDFPAKPEVLADPPPRLLEALGAKATYVGRNQFDYLVEVESEAVLRGLTPDFTRLATLPVRGVIVTARSADGRFDFVSRFFAPASGVDEDPVTGSAHCCLGPYWGRKLSKTEMRAYQASPRGGIIGVRLAGDRVFLAGTAVTVTRGELLVD